MKLFLIILFTCISLFAIEKADISAVIEQKINIATDILQKEKESSATAKADKIFPLFDNVFDYSLMTKLSLGKSNWEKMTSEQKEEFSKKFIEHLKNSFMEKLNLYTDEKLKIIGMDDSHQNRIYLNTELVSSKDKYEIIYKFYKTKDNGWLVYDVDIIGVSLIQTYMAQFHNALEKETYASLLSKLDKK